MRKMIIGAGLIAFAVVTYYVFMVIPNGELGQKEAWSVLQGVEKKYRSAAVSRDPVLLENANKSRYTLLGIPTDDPKFPRAWLILNEGSKSGAAKILPADRRLLIRCSYLSNLQGKVEIDSAALALLEKNCEH